MSFRDLRRTSAEIDEHDSAEPLAGTDPHAASRRSFLRRAATGGVIAVGATAVPVGAMIPSALAQVTPGSGVTSGTTPGTAVAGTTVPPAAGAKKKDPPTSKGADLEQVVFLQTIELAAVDAYKAIVAAGKLSSPVAEAARVAGMHHQDHADALNTFAGSEGLYRANATLAQQLTGRIAAANTAEQLLRVAYDLETSITATWAFAMGELEEWEVAEVAATIMPVSSQQALAWSLELETDIEAWAGDIKTWIPNFQNDSSRLAPAQFAAG